MNELIKYIQELRIKKNDRENYSQEYSNGYTDGINKVLEILHSSQEKNIKTVAQIKQQIMRAEEASENGIKNYEDLDFESSVIFILEWVLGLDDDEPIKFY